MAEEIIKNQSYEVSISGMTSEGSGVAKIDGFAVFVPNTAVGDRLRIKIVKVLKHYGYGIVQEILTPSPDRIENRCPVYSQCGGCCYRHISYESELRIKEQQVVDAFLRIGAILLKPEPIIGSEREEEYRNKAQFPIGLNDDRKAVTGFFANRSHRIVKCTECRLLPPVFNAIARDVVRFINKNRLKVYEEETGRGVFRHIYLRLAEHSGEIMLCIVAAQPELPKEALLVEFITERYPQVKTIVVNHNPDQTNVILGRNERVIFGNGIIIDQLCDVSVEISPKAFYQVNRRQAEQLYLQAIDYAQLTGNETLFDLYCGIGTIGLSAAGRVRLLVGTEIVPEAVENANRNARLNGFSNTRFLCGDCKEAVRQLEQESIRPDVLIVDPPRKGCDPDVLETIVRLSPERVVMVSCNPSTAARDCRLLQEQGYRVVKYRPFDLFPRTKHVETVVMLSHKKPDSVINVKVEFGEGEGKVPLDNIAKRAAAYKPKERVTYKMIKEYIEAKYGFKVHTAYIAEVKRELGLPMYDAPNAVEELKQPRKHPTAEKVEAIKDAMKHFGIISYEKTRERSGFDDAKSR